jgi:Flp pilus assembly protein TadG
MALVCLFLILPMIFGLFAMSLALYTYHYISEAAREGSRYAMVRGSTSCANTPGLTNCGATPTQIQTYVQNLGYPGINAANMTVTTTWSTPSASPPTTWSLCGVTPACAAPRSLVTVTVAYAFPLSIPLYGSTRTLNMSSTSQMVVSQ